MAQSVKNPLAMQETDCSAGDPGLIPGESGGLYSMGSQKRWTQLSD